MKFDIKKIQNEINSEPCGYCGKTHHVELNAAGSVPSPLVTYRFSDDACKEFQEAVKVYVAKKCMQAGFPLP